MSMSSSACAVYLALIVGSVVPRGDQSHENSSHKRQMTQPIFCANNGIEYSFNDNAYNGPSSWPRLSRCCGGNFQSPVNIRSLYAQCGARYRVVYSSTPWGRLPGQLYNTGHIAKMAFSLTPHPLILGGVPESPTSSRYVLSQLHIHVGNQLRKGSEHLINGIGYDGEIHLVHYNIQYGSFEKAMIRPGGLAVIAIFIKLSLHSPNTELNRFINAVSRLQSSKKVPISIDPRVLLPPSGRFYTYPGSLTTPTCSESVRWMVMTDPIPTTQQHTLQRMPTNDGLPVYAHTNIRPLQLLGARTVEANFPCMP